jgi:hypothetical protein
LFCDLRIGCFKRKMVKINKLEDVVFMLQNNVKNWRKNIMVCLHVVSLIGSFIALQLRLKLLVLIF